MAVVGHSESFPIPHSIGKRVSVTRISLRIHHNCGLHCRLATGYSNLCKCNPSCVLRIAGATLVAAGADPGIWVVSAWSFHTIHFWPTGYASSSVPRISLRIHHNCGLHCIPGYCSNMARSARTRKLAGAVSVLVLQAMQSQLCAGLLLRQRGRVSHVCQFLRFVRCYPMELRTSLPFRSAHALRGVEPWSHYAQLPMLFG